jgi:hypothetical protein
MTEPVSDIEIITASGVCLACAERAMEALSAKGRVVVDEQAYQRLYDLTHRPAPCPLNSEPDRRKPIASLDQFLRGLEKSSRYVRSSD